jgi:CheY-like chemotaxis protein
MGGTIWVESEVNVGSTFCFTIVVLQDRNNTASLYALDTSCLVSKRVLLVDDNETNRRILLGQTRSWDMMPQAVSSGQEAIALIKREPPFDIAVLDMEMPEMNGWELAVEIRKYYSTTPIKLVMLTSIGQREADLETVNFDAYVNKPLKPTQLQQILVGVVKGSLSQVLKYVTPNQLDRSIGQRFPLRILLAEDNVVNQKVALNILERIGYRADIAANGIEVLDAIKQRSYDVILMDVQMPEMDGVETTRIIRSQWPESPHLRIIAMTANALQGDREKYLEAGMDSYVSKPVRIEELVEALCQQKVDAFTGEVQMNVESVSGDKPLEDSQMTAVDLSVLKQFQESMGEHGTMMVAELISLFLEDTPPLIEKIAYSYTHNCPDDLYQAAHTLKSSAGSLGVTKLSTLCASLDKIGRDGDLSTAKTLVTEAASEYDKAKSILALELQKILIS